MEQDNNPKIEELLTEARLYVGLARLAIINKNFYEITIFYWKGYEAYKKAKPDSTLEGWRLFCYDIVDKRDPDPENKELFMAYLDQIIDIVEFIESKIEWVNKSKEENLGFLSTREQK